MLLNATDMEGGGQTNPGFEIFLNIPNLFSAQWMSQNCDHTQKPIYQVLMGDSMLHYTRKA
ncbi:uncharacterized protein PHALS_14510 [Plasmopara halstedii]|uniref:Uncharacterized protein n=1 Tax=Plasmopara halstedii TaxID=4781 RepID=A0A0P1AJW1_PLAHL|nr:uncharacterized protein PHALS_14510 [Plasmopara halstedii]CEG41186.1 hypothetical protein PHALS_14510 [Plasmopara halstedii]|eukprot:XP_024577555.1 hypothetical protein PHALS_14510 [Plasmopara halstedii]